MRLGDGALAILGDLPSSRTSTVEVPLGAGEPLGTGVARFSSLRLVHDRLADLLSGFQEPAIVIGGDCGVELAAVEHAIARDGVLPPSCGWMRTPISVGSHRTGLAPSAARWPAPSSATEPTG
ncbi:hypothetical protein GCM10025866_01620 [Naasia aerilata]|uniref:ROK family protein n=2 Tax=Naasia aerilata TaxID=1162966 RepID=A0ABM8G828_9MICO|nr:hypothetical protein GCM10025866_01620 [Naasia aerilata]